MYILYRIFLRVVVGMVGVIMLTATMLSFTTSGKEWFDWISVAPTLIVLVGVIAERNTLERYLDSLEESFIRNINSVFEKIRK